MSTITTLRPSATASGVGWTVDPSGTLHAVTSDDDDGTAAEWTGTGAALILPVPASTPPAGEQRHLVRLRARGEDGPAWWAVRLATGQLVAGASGTFGASVETISGSWQAGAPAAGSTVLSAYVTGQAAGVRIAELYVDVDTRLAPTFDLQVLDGSGASVTTVTDTVMPSLHVDALDTDGLSERTYRMWVTFGVDTVWDTGDVSGPPADTPTVPLADGTYVAHAQVWTTLGAGTAYASTVEDLTFDVLVGTITAPPPPTVLPELPFYRIGVCAPDVDDFDGDVAHVEIQRVDCDDVAVSLTILGPLGTDECAEWVDYTAPRSRVGEDPCGSNPADCCSYYRARTVGYVDGSLVTSGWSDAYNPGLPRDIVIPWPGAVADIPGDWRRVTALDSRYPKGVPDDLTQPGATGGALTHTHTSPGHTHDLTHLHTVTGSTNATTATFLAHDGVAGAYGVPASHTHTRPSTGTAGTSSQSSSPAALPASNEPPRLEVVWISPYGYPTGVPDGGLALMGDIAPSGWTTYSDATGRWLRGAAAGSDGGTVDDTGVSAHTHTVASHTHAGTLHSHTSANTGAVMGSLSFYAGPNTTIWAVWHDHPIVVTASPTASLASESGGETDDPGVITLPYCNVRVRQNGTGGSDLPVGMIAGWRGSLGTIPAAWQVCDGTNGTPDLLGTYPRGAEADIGVTGGSLAAHDHIAPPHTHTTSGHAHAETATASSTYTAGVNATTTVSTVTVTHAHSMSDTNATTPAVGTSSAGELSSVTAEPAYEEVAFIQLMEEPTPPPAPTTFCLEWDDDRHLIRTLMPDGPVYVSVVGVFEWSRDRPFTSATGVSGGRYVVSADPGGRNLRMTAAVESEEDLADLHEVLSRPLVLVSPSDSSEVWASPVTESVRVIRVGRIRQVTADLTATGPEPEPQLSDIAIPGA